MFHSVIKATTNAAIAATISITGFTASTALSAAITGIPACTAVMTALIAPTILVSIPAIFTIANAATNPAMIAVISGTCDAINSTTSFIAGIKSDTIGASTSICTVLPTPASSLFTSSYLICLTSSILPFTSSNELPTLVSDSTNFVPPSSAIVPNASAARFIFSCSPVVFCISATIESITSFCVAPPFFHALNSSCVLSEKPPIPSSMVPSARRVVTSLIASLTLSRLYAPPSQPFCNNWK